MFRHDRVYGAARCSTRSRKLEIQALVREVLARMGQIDILVNVAGVTWSTVLNLALHTFRR